MKNTNPLYIVSKDNVQKAEGLVDYFVKRFNLEPAIEFLMSLIQILLDNVNSYSTFIALKNFVDLVVARIGLFKDFTLL